MSIDLMSMQESGGPSSIPHSFTNKDEEVKVCDICGDAGFDDLLAICSQCYEGAEHVYCMQTLLDTVPPNWVCEECKFKGSQDRVKNRQSIDRQERIATQADVDGTGVKGLRVSASKAFTNKAETIKSSAVSLTSGHLLDNKAAENYNSVKLEFRLAENSATGCSLSDKVPFNLEDVGSLKAPSGIEPNGCSPSSALTQTQSSNDTQQVRTFVHASGMNSSKQASLQPTIKIKGIQSSAEMSLSTNNFSPSNKPAPSPRRVPSKCSSVKVGDDLLSFLLPSRPKELVRSSSGTTRLPSAGPNFKTGKMPNQSGDLGNVICKGSGQNLINSDRKSTVAPKLESFDKPDFTQSKFIRSKSIPVTHTNFQKQVEPVRNMNSLMVCQGVPEDTNLEAGLRNWKDTVASKVSNASGLMESKAISPAKTPRLCGVMGHAAEICSGPSLRESSGATTAGPQRVLQKNTSVRFGDKRLLTYKPLVNVQPNELVCSSNDLQGGGKELKQEKEEYCNESNVEGHKLDSLKKANSNGSKQRPKPVHFSENNEKLCFQGRGVGRLKMEIKPPSPSAYPLLPTPSQNSNCCSPVRNAVPRQLKPVNSGLLQGRHHIRPQIRPLIHPSLQTGKITCKPGQTAHSENMSTALSSHQEPELRAIPDAEILWQGCLKVSSSTGNIMYYSGMQAHASNRADPKVFKAAKDLPAELHVEELQRGVQNDSWPRSFQDSPPASNSIGIFLFPEDMESHDTFYKPLLDRMILYDLTLRVNLEYAQLLIFPSHLLPEAERRWDDMTYLWGVFRANKKNASLTAMRSFLPMVTTPSGPFLDRDAGTHSQSPSVGEVIDMDIDMEGGQDINGRHKNGDRDLSESETGDNHVNSPCLALLPGAHFPPPPPGAPFPPLPPGTPPSQPSPPPTPSHSQQGDSPELLSDVSKHLLPVEQNISAEIAAQRRCSQKQHTSAQCHLSSPPKLHQEGVSMTCSPISYTPELDLVHIGNSSSKGAVQTTSKVSVGVDLKGLSQDSRLASMKSGTLLCSTSSEFQQNGEDASANSIEKGICQQLESRSCSSFGGARIFHAENVNSSEGTQECGRELREGLHVIQEGIGTCEGKDYVRRKICLSTKARDRSKTKVDELDDLKENRECYGKELLKQYHIGSLEEPHCREKSVGLPAAKRLHSDASSSCLCTSLAASPSRSEITGNGILMKERDVVSKCHKRPNSPSSSESLATETGWTPCKLEKLHVESSQNNKACTVQENEEIRNEVIVDTVAKSNGTVEEEKMKGLQCNPGFWENIGTAMQSSRTCGRISPCLRLFPMEESSMEYHRTEISYDYEVDQAGDGSEQRYLVTQSMPLVEQLERRSVGGSTVDMEIDTPRKLAPEEAGKGLSVHDPELTLAIPRYRKQGNIWSRVEDEPISFSSQDVNLSLSLL